MKFMITITIENIENNELKIKLKKIINNEELLLENILDTINEEKNYNKLVLTLKKTYLKEVKQLKSYVKDLKEIPLILKQKVMQY